MHLVDTTMFFASEGGGVGRYLAAKHDWLAQHSAIRHTIVALTEVLFAVLFAWLVLSELPTPIQLAGGVLIVVGLVAVRADEARVLPGPEALAD